VKRKIVDVLFFIEHVSRELEVIALIERELKKINPSIRTHIASLYYEFRTLGTWLDAKIVVMPFCYGIDLYYKQILYDFPRATFINLAFEQIFAPISIAGRVPKDGFSRHAVTHFAWGDDFRQFLRNQGVDAERVIVNGNLPLSLYAPELRSFYPSKQDLARKFGLDARKRWVFFPENYAVAFLTDSSLAAFVKKGSYSQEEGSKYREFARKSLTYVFDWLTSLDPEHFEVIVRPRPAITVRQYRDAFMNRSINEGLKPRFIKKLGVREWILASDLIVSSYSTTLIESAVAGKPTFMLKPLPYFDFMKADWHDYVQTIGDTQEFLKIANKKELPLADELTGWAKEKFGPCSIDPIQGIANYLVSGLGTERFPESPGSCAGFALSWLKRSIPLLYRHHRGHDKDRLSVFVLGRERRKIRGLDI